MGLKNIKKILFENSSETSNPLIGPLPPVGWESLNQTLF